MPLSVVSLHSLRYLESDPSGSGIRELQKEKKPWFEIISETQGYETWEEAEAERQPLEDSD